ncbi:MAG: hypothetical protein F9K51_00230, partial [Candidatus Dadabacteria bacterium]
MSRESEIKQIIEDLKRHLEFQKSMGVARVPVIKEVREDAPPKPPERAPVKSQPKATAAPEKKDDVIRIEQQIGIFDASAKKMTLEEIRAEIGDCTRCKLHEG